MRVHFTDQGWTDYLHWSRHDPKIHARLNELIEDARRSPFKGIGKPEPLKGDLAGFWSRRVTGEHRLVYTVEGKTGADQRCEAELPRADRLVCHGVAALKQEFGNVSQPELVAQPPEHGEQHDIGRELQFVERRTGAFVEAPLAAGA